MLTDARTIDRAHRLRQNMTPQEKHLWYDFLQKHKLHIRKQHPIAFFILDFYCAKAKLAIELDVSQHFTPEGMTYDQARTELLQKYGILVIRFTNKQIDTEFRAVCEAIDRELDRRLKEMESGEL